MNPDEADDLARKAQQFDYVRKALGYLGLALPVTLLGWSALTGHAFAASISDYYHTAMGDVLVGVLWAIGVFLIAYLGYRPTAVERASPRWRDHISDFWVAKLTGLGAIGVAQFPVRGDQCHGLLPCPISGFTHHSDIVHYSCAGVFFLGTAVFCLVLFPRGGSTQANIVATRGGVYPATVWDPRNTYFFRCGVVILAAMAGLGLYWLAARAGLTGVTGALDKVRFFLIAEVAAVLAFAAAWLEKGRALLSPHRISARMRGAAP
ncbi:MAG: hypothetical protein GC146_06905 [Limimaricola sp.]|uniref:hypothetical protein n=1 Tax=Limimaricola sp. TaxID=2211665 RepID=UPI001D2A1ECF|nr:hypothetical protein [Limimaricola sp.]MBI1416932.1 hypothetical protein [Limimaricola sp.]